ncbi:MAG: hypothetical protein ACTSQ4_02880, partial [Candidatus Heimdallarchaeaceae archaeon]
MSALEEIPKPEPKSSVKFSPWISAITILIYSITVQFLLITSMESAFDVVEDFFEQWSSSWLLIEIPIPLILAVIFYTYSQHSRSKNINLFLFSITALGTTALGIVIYIILEQFPIHGQYTDFIFSLTMTTISLIFAVVALIIRKL